MPKEKPTFPIHLDKKAFAETIKSAKAVTALPKAGVRMLLVPNPDGGAEAFPFCHEQGPDTTCKIKSTLQPDGSFGFECQCKPSSPGGGPGGGGGSPTLKPCIMTSAPNIRCLKFDCRGTCEKVYIERPFFGQVLFVVACRCAP